MNDAKTNAYGLQEILSVEKRLVPCRGRDMKGNKMIELIIQTSKFDSAIGKYSGWCLCDVIIAQVKIEGMYFR